MPCVGLTGAGEGAAVSGAQLVPSDAVTGRETVVHDEKDKEENCVRHELHGERCCEAAPVLLMKSSGIGARVGLRSSLLDQRIAGKLVRKSVKIRSIR